MYPYKVFLGLTLYDMLLCAGIVVCFLVFGYLADKHGIKRRIQSFALICGCAAVILGYCSAVLFQALYNIKSLGRFEISTDTGATFYGGLIGGVATFLAIYFGIGVFKFKDMSHARAFFGIADSASPAIVIAHALGRIGCLMAGCCHGELTDAWYGIEMYGNYGFAKYVPTQLFEAIFLLLLFGFLMLKSIDGRGYCLSIYLSVYAVWRFLIEFLRGDYRGDTVISALSPSQLIACILFIVGVGLIFVERHVRRRIALRAADAKDETEDKDEEAH